MWKCVYKHLSDSIGLDIRSNNWSGHSRGTAENVNWAFSGLSFPFLSYIQWANTTIIIIDSCRSFPFLSSLRCANTIIENHGKDVFRWITFQIYAFNMIFIFSDTWLEAPMTWRQSLCLSNILDISSQVWNTPTEKHFWIRVKPDSPDFLLDDILAVNSLSHLTEFILKVQPPNPIWAAEATKPNISSYRFPPGRCSHSHLCSAAYILAT